MTPSHKESNEQYQKLFRYMTITKKSAAVAQLEDAILLWFGEGNPISIHTLAVASQDCFHAMSKLKGEPSVFKTWLAAQEPAFRKKVTYAQNFFKHGFKDLKRSCEFSPFYSEVMLFDAVVCCLDVFGKLSGTMLAFGARFLIEHRNAVRPKTLHAFTKGIDIDKFSEVGRADFLRELTPLLKTGKFFGSLSE